MRVLHKLSKSIFYSFLLYSHLNAFVGFKLMKEGDNMILLIEDIHYNALNEMNHNHVQWFQKLFKDYPIQSKTKLIYELSEELAGCVQQQNIPTHLDLVSTFNDLALMHKNSNDFNNIEFLPFDCRGLESEAIGDFFAGNNAFFDNNPTLKEFKKFKSKYTSAMAQNPQWVKLSKLNFLKALKRNQKTIEQWRNAYLEHSSKYEIFNNTLLKYEEGITKIASYLNGKPNKEDIRLLLMSFFDKCREENLGEKFNELANIFRKETDYIFADVGFLAKILQSFDEGFSKTILIAGMTHSQGLAVMLEQLGYETISEFRIVKPVGTQIALDYYYEMDLINKLSSAINFMFFPEQSLSQEQLQIHEDTAIRYCNRCQTLESEQQQLQKCGKCRQTLYCSRDCQLKHWPLHKIVCRNQNH